MPIHILNLIPTKEAQNSVSICTNVISLVPSITFLYILNLVPTCVAYSIGAYLINFYIYESN